MTITAASPPVSQRIRNVLGLLMVLLGAAGTATPKRLDTMATGDAAQSEAQRHHLIQMYAMREAALGAVLLGGGSAKSALGAAVGLTAVEVVTGLRSPALDTRSRITTAVSASLIGAVAAYAWTGAAPRKGR
jgi:cytosine/adenosine deaminase-related metal-dependent hydrolase